MAYMESDSVGTLVRSALDDVRELFREELALARVELRHELSKAAAAGLQLGMAGMALLFAMGCMVVALAMGVSILLGWPTWAGFGMVAVLLAIVGVVLLYGGRRAMRSVQPLPRTVHSIKENFR